MKRLISIISMMILTSCSTLMPDLFRTVGDIETNSVIKVEVDKEAFDRDTKSVDVVVHIQNKEK